MFKIFSTDFVEYLKCSDWRLAMWYDIHIYTYIYTVYSIYICVCVSLGGKGLMLRFCSTLWPNLRLHRTLLYRRYETRNFIYGSKLTTLHHLGLFSMYTETWHIARDSQQRSYTQLVCLSPQEMNKCIMYDRSSKPLQPETIYPTSLGTHSEIQCSQHSYRNTGFFVPSWQS
jgi:hypothetical protein